MDAIIIVFLVIALVLAILIISRGNSRIEELAEEISSLREQVEGVKQINKFNSEMLREKRPANTVSETDFCDAKTYTYAEIKQLWEHIENLDRVIGIEPGPRLTEETK